jgi:DNA-binding transcriptional MerR regulator
MDQPATPTLSIGTFARRSRLSPKALRLYDRLGVLSPAQVDARTGYRRYAESQLETARLVVSLRRLEMPLARVAAVIAAPSEQRGNMLAAYWAEVEWRVAGQRQLVDHLQIQLAGAAASFARTRSAAKSPSPLPEQTGRPHPRVLGCPAPLPPTSQAGKH